MAWLFQRFAKWPSIRLPLTEDEQQAQNLRRTIVGLAIWIIGSALLLPICALRVVLSSNTSDPWGDGLDIICHGGLLSLAFAAIGGLIGFLFGIPKTPPSDKNQGDHSADSPAQSPPNRPTTNTNLEEVSDWLTKIILGAGLTQLVRIPEKVKALGIYFEAEFCHNKLLPEAMAIHSAILGFFIAYLITRLFLAGAFVKADRSSAAERVSRALRQADNQLDRQDYRDAAATLETAIGSIGPGTPPETRLLYYERLTNAALYEPEPIGFRKVIEYFKRFAAQETRPPSARLYVNLACAYGQQYSWESRNQKRPEVLLEAQQRALDAARKAIQAEPSAKTILRLVWDPHVTKIEEEENDLQPFYDDPDFKALLA